jgi:hypothetical protein
MPSTAVLQKVCMYVRMYASLYVCMYAYVRVCVCVCDANDGAGECEESPRHGTRHTAPPAAGAAEDDVCRSAAERWARVW